MQLTEAQIDELEPGPELDHLLSTLVARLDADSPTPRYSSDPEVGWTLLNYHPAGTQWRFLAEGPPPRNLAGFVPRTLAPESPEFDLARSGRHLAEADTTNLALCRACLKACLNIG